MVMSFLFYNIGLEKIIAITEDVFDDGKKYNTKKPSLKYYFPNRIFILHILSLGKCSRLHSSTFKYHK